jgi:signal transduction histidine kinase
MSETTIEGKGHAKSDRPRWDSRWALAIGFGGMLLLVAVAGLTGLRFLHQIRADDERIRTQFLLRNRLLNEIRSELYLSGTYVRDYLLDPDPLRGDSYHLSLEQVHRAMDNALTSYADLTETARDTPFAALQTELAEYWNVLGPILQWDPATRHSRGYEFLRDVVFPRRTAMLDIAGRIASINEEQLNAGNERVGALLNRFEFQMGGTLIVTLLLGLAMATFSIRKTLGLERDAHARYVEVVAAREQAAQLSGRLVQAQETERRALSLELHDEIGQSLSAALVELGNLSGQIKSEAETRQHNLQDQIEVIKELVEGTVGAVRRMALSLRPSMLDDLGLIPALKWQAREVSKRTAIDVTVTADLASDDLPEEYKTCIYRVVQEALRNAAAHSGASIARVNVQQQLDKLLLSIQDDGRGFDAGLVKGLGLLGVEERVARLGGTCRIYSGPGQGTLMAIELPFPRRPNGTSPIGTKKETREANSHSFGG